MPSIRDFSNSAVDNDLMIKSLSFHNDRGQVKSNYEHLMADDNLSVYVNIGFEDGMAHEKPFPGNTNLD